MLSGKQIRRGDKVIMGYTSRNRDTSKIDRPDEFIINRKGARNQISFGFGMHRCMGNRLAEMQLRTVWEEILKHFDRIEVVGEPCRLKSNFVREITRMPVILYKKAQA
ncbi:MAG: cytochrome P450 [Saprospiraceae bacterium]|jgi:cytochrome P450